MNYCLVKIAVDYPQLRKRAIAIGNRLEVLKDYPVPKGCTSPFAPIWIAYIMSPRTKKPEGLTVRWRKYRGPQTGVATFTPATAQLMDGKSSTKVGFSQPGEYVVQAVVDDGSLLAGTYCCWVSQEVKITVK